VVVPGEASLTLRRTYWTCPRCGEGLFPSDGRSGVRVAQ